MTTESILLNTKLTEQLNRNIIILTENKENMDMQKVYMYLIIKSIFINYTV